MVKHFFFWLEKKIINKKNKKIKNNVLASTRVPLIVLKRTALPCDIVVLDPMNHQRTRLIRAFVSLDERVRPFVLLVTKKKKNKQPG